MQGQRILPGAAHLEMARAAMSHAIDYDDVSISIYINVYPAETGEFSYEIYVSDRTHEETTIFSRGIATITTKAMPTVDLDAIKERTQAARIDSDVCYARFKTLGIAYGASHQGIKVIHQGKEEALAQLHLPAAVQDKSDQFVLHPSLMDSALQAVMGLMNDDDLQIMLPFSLTSIDIFSASAASSWAWVRHTAGASASAHGYTVDIDVMDEHGQVYTSLKGMMYRPLNPPASKNIPETLTSNSR